MKNLVNFTLFKNISNLTVFALSSENFKRGSRYKRTGKAGIFAGSLELVKEGNLKINKDKKWQLKLKHQPFQSQ